MGSKLGLLANGLEGIIDRNLRNSDHFVDLFSGSAAVGNLVAQKFPISVTSIDVQRYSQLLSAAVICRTETAEPVNVERWVDQVSELTERQLAEMGFHPGMRQPLSSCDVARARALCERSEGGFAWSHYGGHYYSPYQARWIDNAFATLPREPLVRSICHAALIKAASHCAAAPGHTAQPFQPTPRLLPHIHTSWMRQIDRITLGEGTRLCAQFAQRPGRALVGDYTDALNLIRSGDVVFCDPPYSAVQYSRFYHVLEAIAVGGWESVGGAGRSPQKERRFASHFSMVGRSAAVFSALLTALRDTRATVIFTFPSGRASNGISGAQLLSWSAEHFNVEVAFLANTHSTLGGNGLMHLPKNRHARAKLNELVLVMTPR